ncbi:hypothetical protein AVEN_164162-1 [Araneus ventricosus]|uniref:Uncharacterized protein n=1 Tax=Araneus ventricosus TaxID=182803 RepID=A0A4Y2IDZ1_ARAVE|nr:hypothetical protein AVEN_164162-1 [Araneus ventricosus]
MIIHGDANVTQILPPLSKPRRLYEYPVRIGGIRRARLNMQPVPMPVIVFGLPNCKCKSSLHVRSSRWAWFDGRNRRRLVSPMTSAAILATTLKPEGQCMGFGQRIVPNYMLLNCAKFNAVIQKHNILTKIMAIPPNY